MATNPYTQYNTQAQQPLYAPYVQAPMPQFQMPAPQCRQPDMIWVQGEAGMKAYMMAPNTRAILWDQDNPVIYIKTAVPEGGTAGPIALAITVNGEQRPTSHAIFTPAAVETYGNVTSTAIIKVPKGCCFTVSVRAVSGLTDDPAGVPAPTISVQNANLVIDRIA